MHFNTSELLLPEIITTTITTIIITIIHFFFKFLCLVIGVSDCVSDYLHYHIHNNLLFFYSDAFDFQFGAVILRLKEGLDVSHIQGQGIRTVGHIMVPDMNTTFFFFLVLVIIHTGVH